MKRLLLGICLACSIAAGSGCCGPCSDWRGWNPCGGGCGNGGCGDGGCGDCGDCGPSGGCGFGRPGGCGEWYWGDWCTGNPRCQTCDNCANWIGPDAPGGDGSPPSVYGKAHPYGNLIAGARIMPPKEYSPQLVRRMNPRQYASRPAPQMAQRSAPARYDGYPQQPQLARRQPANTYGPATQVVHRQPANASGPAPQYASRQIPEMAPPRGQVVRRGDQREYEGAIEYLGTTDRIVTPAEAPQMARRGQPTLAAPMRAEPAQSEPAIRQAQARQPMPR